MMNYCGEHLKDVLLQTFLKHDLTDKSWCSLTRYIENDSFKDNENCYTEKNGLKLEHNLL